MNSFPFACKFRFASFPGLWLAATLTLALPAGAQPAAPKTAGGPADPPAPAAFTADKGTFQILLNGKAVGKEEFEISESPSGWTASGTTDIQAPDSAPARVTATLELQRDGTPVRYEWKMDGEKKASSTVEFQGSGATVELRLGEARPYTQSFSFSSPRIAVLDNNFYHHYEVLALLYDWQKKGAQSLPVLVPQELTPGTVTVEALGEQTDNGKKVDAMRVKTEDLEVDLFFEGPRLVRLVVPSSNAEVVRQ